MSSRPLPSQSQPKPEEFRPENFKRKSGFRDYVIYAVTLATLLGFGGASLYYFTRSKMEREILHARIETKMKEAGLEGAPAPTPVPKLKDPKVDSLLGDDDTGAKAEAAAAKKGEIKAIGISAYAGGGPNRLIFSGDSKLPKATSAFIEFVESLKISSVVQSRPAKVMIAGRLYRCGEIVDEKLGVTFEGVDAAKSAVIFRDYTGAELLLSY